MTRRAILAAAGFLMVTTPAWPCDVAGNLIGGNCNFDSAADVPTYTILAADSCLHNTGDGSSGVGNLECNAFSGGAGFVVRFNRCITSGILASTAYGYGADARLVSAVGTPPTCNVQVAGFSVACGNTNVDSDAASLTPVIPTYTQSLPDTYTSGVGVVQVEMEINCNAPSDFVVRFDDVFFGQGLTPVELQDFSVGSD